MTTYFLEIITANGWRIDVFIEAQDRKKRKKYTYIYIYIYIYILW